MLKLSSAVTSHTMDLADGKNGYYRVRVYSAATHVQLNKMDCGLILRKITLYKLLQEIPCVIMAPGLFLPANSS